MTKLSSYLFRERVDRILQNWTLRHQLKVRPVRTHNSSSPSGTNPSLWSPQRRKRQMAIYFGGIYRYLELIAAYVHHAIVSYISVPLWKQTKGQQLENRWKNTLANRCRSDKKLSLVPILSSSTSEVAHFSPRGTRYIFFFLSLTGEMTDWNLCHQESCVCFISECDDSQSSSSGSGRAGNKLLFFRPFFKKVFSSFGSRCKLPRSRIVVVDAVAILDVWKVLRSRNIQI